MQGKTLFITGASRGIGLAIALRAARDGANIAIAAKTAEPHPKLEGTIYTAAKEIEAAGGKALPIVCDIRFEEQVQAAVGQDGGDLRRPRHLRQQRQRHLAHAHHATDMKRYDLMHGINARGTFLVSKTCIPHLKKAANPHILMLSPPLDMNVQVVRPARRLHDGQVQHEHHRARPVRRAEGATASPSTRCGRAPPSPPRRSRTCWAATP